MDAPITEGSKSFICFEIPMSATIDWTRKDRPETVSLIVDEYLPLASRIAKKRIRSMTGYVDEAAIYSAANMGLLRAITTFTPGKSAFSTYARMRIENTIADTLREIDPLSRKSRQDTKRHAAIAARLDQEAGRTVSDGEFQSLTGEDRLRAPEHHAVECLKTRTPQIAPEVSEYERSESFRMATRGLTLDEQTILYLYFYKQARMRDIGSIMGYSESRVSQLCKAILERLKKFKPRVIDALATR